MLNWINIQDQKPEQNQKVFYYFSPIGVHAGKYKQIIYPKEFTGSDEIVKGDCFNSGNGWLVDDVTHWMPRGNNDDFPQPPNKGDLIDKPT
jgi:hypothetical protein